MLMQHAPAFTDFSLPEKILSGVNSYLPQVVTSGDGAAVDDNGAGAKQTANQARLLITKVMLLDKSTRTQPPARQAVLPLDEVPPEVALGAGLGGEVRAESSGSLLPLSLSS